MKKLLSATFLIVTLLLLSQSTVIAQQNDIKVGAGLLYGAEAESIGLQVNGTFGITPEIAIAPDLSVFFPEYGSYFAVNVNGHYIFSRDTQYQFYGLAGLNLSTIEYDDLPESETELGLNLGAGGEYKLDNFALFGEIKYVISNFDGVVLGAGIRLPLN